MRLHPNTVEAVRSRVDLAEIAGERLTLKKQGKALMGLCPFHTEKTPSFSVDGNLFYCFGCGSGGDAIAFLMELDKRNFTDVVVDLAGRYQVPVETLEPENREAFQRALSERERLREVMAAAVAFYEAALRSPVGAHALEYLRRDRGMSDGAIAQFHLGYAPGGWTPLMDALAGRYDTALIERAGLILPRKSGGGFYDRFRDRLMVPIYDAQGRAIAFGGRTLSGEEPKYLNSPETPLFEKGKNLYALDQAKGAIASADQAIVVEGYFDAIALHDAGFPQTVAALGTALSAEQIKALARHTRSRQIIFNFDGDQAGGKATDRAIASILPQALAGEVNLRVLSLPESKDADEFLRERSPEAFADLVAAAPSWIDWQLAREIRDRDLSQGDQFQAAMTAAIALLRQLPPTSRSHYLRHAADELSRGDRRMAQALERDLRSAIADGTRGSAHPQSKPLPLRRTIEGDLLWLALNDEEQRLAIAAELATQGLTFGMASHRQIWRNLTHGGPTPTADDVAAPGRAELLATLDPETLRTTAIAAIATLDQSDRDQWNGYAWGLSVLGYRSEIASFSSKSTPEDFDRISAIEGIVNGFRAIVKRSATS